MQKRMKLFSLIICFVIAFSGCDALFPTPISNILQRPRSYEGTQVMVSGKVVDAFSLLVIKCFVVKDDTGEITVVTERPLPKKGEQIKVIGKVQEAFSLGDQQLIVLMENPVKK